MGLPRSRRAVLRRRRAVAATALTALLGAGLMSAVGLPDVTALRRDVLGCTATEQDAAPLSCLDARQLRNATTIVERGREAGVPEAGLVIAVATALQESELRNLASEEYPATWDDPRAEGRGSDHDSVGLFQQRPSAGWGRPGELLDPARAADLFFTGRPSRDIPGLLDVDGWESMELWEAATAVQRPDARYAQRYQDHEPFASAIVAALLAG